MISIYSLRSRVNGAVERIRNDKFCRKTQPFLGFPLKDFVVLVVAAAATAVNVDIARIRSRNIDKRLLMLEYVWFL